MSSPFTEFMQGWLPPTVSLPPIFRDLFDWIDSNGWVVRGAREELFGSLSPGKSWMHHGTSVTFHVEPLDVRAQYSRLWSGVSGLHDRLVPFARTGADGSEAAFWLDPQGIQRIVHMGSGSGSLVTCVLATDPVDFLRLLAIGYPELCSLDEPQFAEPPQRDDGHSIVNAPFRDWLAARGVSVPRTAREIVPRPAVMGDADTTDAFCAWLNAVTRPKA
ncbi:MAG: hypothetical protein ACJ790_23315 [Myxococcaceae bacterium]